MTIYPLASATLYVFLVMLSSFIGTINTLYSSRQTAFLCVSLLLYLLSARFYVGKKIPLRIIIGISICAGGLFIFHALNPSFFSFLQAGNLQFIVATNGGHNHLGDLAGLGLIALFISPVSLVGQLCIGVFFFLLIIVSFSKSAFLALVITLFFMMITKRGKYFFIFIVIASLAIVSVILYSQEFSSFQPIAQIQSQMKKTLHLEPKQLISSRDIYFAQAAQAWMTSSLEHSFFGYGPANFIYASSKSAQSSWNIISDSHNFLLTTFIESGPLALFWFIIFFVLTVYAGYKTNNPLVFLVLFLFLNFQTDYTYLIPFFFLSFFFFSGQIIAPLMRTENKTFLHWLICSIFILSICSGIYALYQNQRYTNLNFTLMQYLMKKSPSIDKNVPQELEKITPYDEYLLMNLSLYYEKSGNIKEAVRLLDKLSLYAPHNYLSLLPQQLDLQIKGRMNVMSYLESRRKDFARFPFTIKEKKTLNTLCEKYAKISCVSSY